MYVIQNSCQTQLVQLLHFGENLYTCSKAEVMDCKILISKILISQKEQKQEISRCALIPSNFYVTIEPHY